MNLILSKDKNCNLTPSFPSTRRRLRRSSLAINHAKDAKTQRAQRGRVVIW